MLPEIFIELPNFIIVHILNNIENKIMSIRINQYKIITNIQDKGKSIIYTIIYEDIINIKQTLATLGKTIIIWPYFHWLSPKYQHIIPNYIKRWRIKWWWIIIISIIIRWVRIRISRTRLVLIIRIEGKWEIKLETISQEIQVEDEIRWFDWKEIAENYGNEEKK